MKALKWIGIVFLGLFILGLLLPDENKKETTVTNKVTDVAVDTLVDVLVEKKSTIDSVKIKELKHLFKHKKDEFSEDKTEWITPIDAAKYRNQNGLYCYFSESNLRFVLQYHSDDWLFIRNCQFLIDDKPYNFTPEGMKRDNDETGITEWFDVNVNNDNGATQIVKALAVAKSAKVRLNGDNYYHVTNFTPKQLKSIKTTLEYYKALGYSI